MAETTANRDVLVVCDPGITWLGTLAGVRTVSAEDQVSSARVSARDGGFPLANGRNFLLAYPMLLYRL